MSSDGYGSGLSSRWLEKTGLTNRHAEMGEYDGETRRTRVAYCSSYTCLLKYHGFATPGACAGPLASNKAVRKSVGGQAWQCPDCFRMLFWELE